MYQKFTKYVHKLNSKLNYWAFKSLSLNPKPIRFKSQITSGEQPKLSYYLNAELVSIFTKRVLNWKKELVQMKNLLMSSIHTLTYFFFFRNIILPIYTMYFINEGSLCKVDLGLRLVYFSFPVCKRILEVQHPDFSSVTTFLFSPLREWWGEPVRYQKEQALDTMTWMKLYTSIAMRKNIINWLISFC